MAFVCVRLGYTLTACQAARRQCVRIESNCALTDACCQGLWISPDTSGHAVDEALVLYLSPLGWGHINLTRAYLWRSSAKIGAGKFRPLRAIQSA